MQCKLRSILTLLRIDPVFGCWHGVEVICVADVSEENAASTCRIEEYKNARFHTSPAPKNRLYHNITLPYNLKRQCLCNNIGLFVPGRVKWTLRSMKIFKDKG
jgi:hypothetical protein